MQYMAAILHRWNLLGDTACVGSGVEMLFSPHALTAGWFRSFAELSVQHLHRFFKPPKYRFRHIRRKVFRHDATDFRNNPRRGRKQFLDDFFRILAYPELRSDFVEVPSLDIGAPIMRVLGTPCHRHFYAVP